MKSKERTAYEQAYADHLETWGPHCGAPRSVFKGHLDVLLLAHSAALRAELRSGEGGEPA